MSGFGALLAFDWSGGLGLGLDGVKIWGGVGDRYWDWDWEGDMGVEEVGRTKGWLVDA